MHVANSIKYWIKLSSENQITYSIFSFFVFLLIPYVILNIQSSIRKNSQHNCFIFCILNQLFISNFINKVTLQTFCFTNNNSGDSGSSYDKFWCFDLFFKYLSLIKFFNLHFNLFSFKTLLIHAENWIEELQWHFPFVNKLRLIWIYEWQYYIELSYCLKQCTFVN